jgi:hypothetical protein
VQNHEDAWKGERSTAAGELLSFETYDKWQSREEERQNTERACMGRKIQSVGFTMGAQVNAAFRAVTIWSSYYSIWAYRIQYVGSRAMHRVQARRTTPNSILDICHRRQVNHWTGKEIENFYRSER